MFIDFECIRSGEGSLTRPQSLTYFELIWDISRLETFS